MAQRSSNSTVPPTALREQADRARADAQRIRSFALGVTASEVLAELCAMIQELERRAPLLEADARGRSS